MFPRNSTTQYGQQAHHQYGQLAHHYHYASSAEQANHNTRPDDTARKKEPRSRGTRAGRRHRQKPHTRNTGYDTRLTQQPVTYQPVTQKHHHSVDTLAKQIAEQTADQVTSQLAEQIAEQVMSPLRLTLHDSHERQMTQLRLTLEKQRDDIGKSFRQILFSNTRKSNYNTVSNTDNDDMDSNTDNDDMDSNTDNDDMGSITDDDVDESDSEQETDDDMDESDDYSVSNADVAPSSHTNQALLSPGARSLLDKIKDPFVGALTKRHSLTQLHKWLNSIKCSVNTSISIVTSQHLYLHLISQLTVTEPLSTLPFSTQLNRGHHHFAWSGFAKYENFKPWKTKRSFHL